jgi:uncharacterized protein YdeI (YjbR/CyaY-like superfamily)
LPEFEVLPRNKTAPLMGMTVRFFSSQSAFRKWLEQHHDQSRELWVGFYRKESGRGGITYREALDEALCFGWIDGLRKSVDDASYTIRFTPRKADSIWSEINTQRVGELTRLGRMQKPGLTAFKARDLKKSRQYSYERNNCRFEAAQENKFKENAQAWEFFRAQAPWYQRTTTWWVVSAKREETRLKRLATLIEDSEKGRRIGPLDYPKNKRKRG